MRTSVKNLNVYTAEEVPSGLIELKFLSPVIRSPFTTKPITEGGKAVYYSHFLDKRGLKELKKVLSKF